MPARAVVTFPGGLVLKVAALATSSWAPKNIESLNKPRENISLKGMGTVQKILHVFNALGKKVSINSQILLLPSFTSFLFLPFLVLCNHSCFFSLLWRIIQIIKVAANLERKIVDLIKNRDGSLLFLKLVSCRELVS